MAVHKFKAGQMVHYHPPKSLLVGVTKCTIVRLLPIEEGHFKYRIKSVAEHFERVAKESELSA